MVSGGSSRSVPGSGTLTISAALEQVGGDRRRVEPILEPDPDHQARGPAPRAPRRAPPGPRAGAGPCSRTARSSAGSSTMSRTASAAAAATGPPAKVEPWSPGSRTRPASGVGDAGADREAAAERLGAGHHIGPHRGLLVGPERAGPPDPGLDLVEDQQRPDLVAGLARRQQRLVADRVDAGLALDRLDQDGGGALADRAAQRLGVVERDRAEARRASGPEPDSPARPGVAESAP